MIATDSQDTRGEVAFLLEFGVSVRVWVKVMVRVRVRVRVGIRVPEQKESSP